MSVYLVIYRPDGEIYRTEGQEDDRYDLSERMNSTNRQITIGRTDPAGQFDVGTDIKLPAEDTKISRKHFVIEVIEGPYYYVRESERPSANGTILHQHLSGNRISIQQQGQLLCDKDEILLQSSQGQEGSPNQYWKFQFRDLNATATDEPVRTPEEDKPVQVTIYEYRLKDGLYVSLDSANCIRIDLTGQKFNLLNYMAQQSYKIGDNNNNHRIVKYEELIKAIWPGEKYGDRKPDLSGIVSRIHSKIRKNCSSQNLPDLIDNSSGVGYWLINCTVTD